MEQTFNPKLITVIGGSGFVGTYFCDLLTREGMAFEILDLTESRSYPKRTKICDVRDKKSLKQAITGDVVVNLAAVHRDNVTEPDAYYETNVVGARNVAKVCKEKNVRKLIFTSTVAVYGFAPPGTDESGKLKPFNEYGRTKMLAEMEYTTHYANDNNILNIIRPTVIFGPGNRGNVFNLLNSIARNRFLMIGNGLNKKSMAYIGNVVEFLLWSARYGSGHSIKNYVDGPDLSMAELVALTRKVLNQKSLNIRIPVFFGLLAANIFDLISRITGRNFAISAVRVKKFCSTTSFDSAITTNGFKPLYSLKESLEHTIEREFLRQDCVRTYETE